MTDVLQLIAAYAIGFAVALVLWWSGRGVFEAEVFQRRNYRDHPLPTAVGIVLPLAGAVVIGVFQIVVDVSRDIGLVAYGRIVLAICVAFCFLGLVDDLAGVGESGGFKGHIAALRHGRVTTGMIKLVGGPLFAFALMGGDATFVDSLRYAALICLAANLANLFDRAPGRVDKVAQLAFVALVVATRQRTLAPVAVIVGAAGGLLDGDLREVYMLGDAGSNALGAVLGVGVLLTCTPTVQWVVVAVLLVLNLASEAVSFTRVIDAVPAFRRFDRLGSPYRSR